MILLAVVRDHARLNELHKIADKINNTILINPYKDGLEKHRLQPSKADRSKFYQSIDQSFTNPEKYLINDCYHLFDKKMSKKLLIKFNKNGNY